MATKKRSKASKKAKKTLHRGKGLKKTQTLRAHGDDSPMES